MNLKALLLATLLCAILPISAQTPCGSSGVFCDSCGRSQCWGGAQFGYVIGVIEDTACQPTGNSCDGGCEEYKVAIFFNCNGERTAVMRYGCCTW